MTNSAKPSATFTPLDHNSYQRSLEKTLSQAREIGILKVFAYGSLVWRPCFPIAATTAASLAGYKRCFCVWTVQARGTVERPGLGLGLVAEQGICQGHLLSVAPPHVESALSAMWEREMLTGVYQPTWIMVDTTYRQEQALTFCVNTAHPQFAGVLPTAEQAQLIATAAGQLGSNRQYLYQTVASLQQHRLKDPHLEALAEQVRTEYKSPDLTRT